MNWECALLCESLNDGSSRRGVWVDLPPGHYQFRFICDGKWMAVNHYPQINNEYGEANNWRVVE